MNVIPSSFYSQISSARRGCDVLRDPHFEHEESYGPWKHRNGNGKLALASRFPHGVFPE